MTKIKKNIFFITKAASALVIFLALVLFIYAAFFFNAPPIEKKIVKNEIIEEEILKEEERLIKEKRLKALKGMVPSLLNMGDGCKLCSRFDGDDCACGGTKVEPELYEASPGHFVRCNPEILK